MKLSETYKWKVELIDSTIISRDDIVKNKELWTELDLDLIVKVTYEPQIGILPIHNILIDKSSGERVTQRFSRGFLKPTDKGYMLVYYVHCVVTNNYRYWVRENGSTLVTHKDYEVRL